MDLVPARMTEKAFWGKYYRAEYLFRTRNVAAAEAEAADDDELALFVRDDPHLHAQARQKVQRVDPTLNVLADVSDDYSSLLVRLRLSMPPCPLACLPCLPVAPCPPAWGGGWGRWVDACEGLKGCAGLCGAHWGSLLAWLRCSRFSIPLISPVPHPCASPLCRTPSAVC
ncbi:unnamed protein product [Closterium sp. Yama58-4]|nr:unnamed protein product [Closterium sp. Yama58-4]